MPVINIADLASVMIEIIASKFGHKPKNIKIDVIAKPGEKMYEELLSDEEVRRTIELDKFYCITPAFKGIYQNINYNYGTVLHNSVDQPYNSAIETVLSREKLVDYLNAHELLKEVSECVS